MLHSTGKTSTPNGNGGQACGPAAAPCEASANVSAPVILATVTLVLLIAASARAQDYRTPALGAAPPSGTVLPLPNGTRQHYVGPHFDAKGRYVPPHYEATKQLPFRGYYSADEAAREAQKQHGYTEPPPDYTTPDTGPGKKQEDR